MTGTTADVVVIGVRGNSPSVIFRLAQHGAAGRSVVERLHRARGASGK